MKNLPLYISLLLLLTCAKEDSQAPNTPPSQITRQNTLTVSAGDGGSVSTTGGTFASGTQVSITATPNAGYSFSGWSNGSTANPLAVTLNSNTTVTANFEVIVNSYTLTVTAGEGGTVSGGGDYEEGLQVTITATPAEGFEFTGWSDGETLAERSVTITSDFELIAEFDQLKFLFYNVNINHPSKNDIYAGSSLAANSSILYNKNGINNLIFNPSIGRGEQVYYLPIIHMQKNNNNWEVINYYENIDMTFGGRDVDFFDDSNIFYADHGSESFLTTGGEPPYNHVWHLNVDNYEWTRVSEQRAYFHNVSSGDLNHDGLIDVVSVPLGPTEALLDNQYRALAFIANNQGSYDLSDIFKIPHDKSDIYDCYWWTFQNGVDKNTCPTTLLGSVLIEDLDNDNYPEIITGTYNYAESLDHFSDNGIDIWSDKDLDGIYELQSTIIKSNWLANNGLGTSQIKASDINGDGLKDLIVEFEGNFGGVYSGTADFNGITVYKNNGDGNYEIFQEIPYFDIRSAAFELVDFDNDGDEDIIINVSQGSFDLGGNQEQSKWYNGESNFITNLEENGRYYDADFNFDYLIWENFNSEFIQSDHSLTLRLEKGIGLYGDGIQFIKSAYIDNKFIFYGIYNEYDETTNDKSFKIFEYTPFE
jgi:hypothetical protein